MGNHININGNVSNIQIQQGTNNSSQTNQTDFEKYQAIIDQINKFRPQFANEVGERADTLVKALDDAQEALNTKNGSKLKKAMSVVKDVAVGVGSGLIASGILELVK